MKYRMPGWMVGLSTVLFILFVWPGVIFTVILENTVLDVDQYSWFTWMLGTASVFYGVVVVGVLIWMGASATTTMVGLMAYSGVVALVYKFSDC